MGNGEWGMGNGEWGIEHRLFFLPLPPLLPCLTALPGRVH
ncbi:hypothetical protein GXM_03835 [Nostoc sphaeroides CCNUC1]|uniref:Uncharacterized protein n=1 Tax=Nostoc sphaeroides CCNUC1 TaxID=2653204 RepID=A0A5P8W185_9NOSO|nr:hypothetical protein GXM_03835 [Nostoc sphaeroides CCNUC1]